ncbi:hypothetical protein 1 [Hubei toti-like virus 18]|uniref:Uncharacterized protein n=1 Tax=Hubei toti-like virus 18 TaxID=1923306 RepID=A0A1L3KF58_9VIRU|nr:hypothetical protein 1 [Hubei toti-like virus 18]APG76041.1 hypothetical protein 1 [Hubei toti-like virus 18]
MASSQAFGEERDTSGPNARGMVSAQPPPLDNRGVVRAPGLSPTGVVSGRTATLGEVVPSSPPRPYPDCLGAGREAALTSVVGGRGLTRAPPPATGPALTGSSSGGSFLSLHPSTIGPGSTSGSSGSLTGGSTAGSPGGRDVPLGGSAVDTRELGQPRVYSSLDPFEPVVVNKGDSGSVSVIDYMKVNWGIRGLSRAGINRQAERAVLEAAGAKSTEGPGIVSRPGVIPMRDAPLGRDWDNMTREEAMKLPKIARNLYLSRELSMARERERLAREKARDDAFKARKYAETHGGSLPPEDWEEDHEDRTDRVPHAVRDAEIRLGDVSALPPTLATPEMVRGTAGLESAGTPPVAGIFTGCVKEGLEVLYRAAFSDEQLEVGNIARCEDAAKKLAQATMGAITTPALHKYQRLQEDDPAADALYAGVPTRPDSFGRRTTFRRRDDGTDAQGRTKTKEERVDTTVRRGGLKEAANKLASTMLRGGNKGYRVAQFLSRSVNNPLFCVAVCRALLQQRVTAQLLVSGLGSIAKAQALVATIHLYAARPEAVTEPALDTSDEELLRGGNLSRVPLTDPSYAMSVALTHNRPLASKLLDCDVCAVCVAACLVGEEPPKEFKIPTTEADKDAQTTETPVTVYKLRSLIKNGASARYLAAVAAAHNREQHSENGNISFVVGLGEPRSAVIDRCIDFTLAPPSQPITSNRDGATHVRLQQFTTDEMTVRVDDQRSTPVLQPAANLHQLVRIWVGGELPQEEQDENLPRESLRPPATISGRTPRTATRPKTRTASSSDVSTAGSSDQGSQPVAGPSSRPDGTSTAPPAPQSQKAGKRRKGVLKKIGSLFRIRDSAAAGAADAIQAVADACHEFEACPDPIVGSDEFLAAGVGGREIPALYIGVGQSFDVGTGAFHITASTQDFQRAIEEGNTRDPRIGSRQPQNVLGFLANVPYLVSALASSLMIDVSDLTCRSLKVALYEGLREKRVTNPIGVSYAAPLAAPMPKEYVPLDVIQQWQFTYTVIGYDVLDGACRLDGLIPIEGGQQWSLRSPEVTAVVLDYDLDNIRTAWALQTLAALPYPLLWVTEWQTVVERSPEGRERWRFCQFLRNEGLVSINDSVRHVVFVTTTRAASISLGGVEQNVAHLLPNGTFPPIPSLDATPLILNCLQIAMGSDLPLPQVWERQVSNRLGGASLNWTRINNYVTYLTTRWHQQVEIVTDDQGGSIITGWDGSPLPPNCPPAWADPSSEVFFCEDTVTAGDNIFTPRPDADVHPALRLGAWSNYAELATGFKVATYSSEFLNATHVDAQIRTSGYDRLTKAKYMRRAVEEWKQGTSVTDEVASPTHYNLLRAWWEVLVYGKKDDEQGLLSLKELIALILGVEGNNCAGLSWENNYTRAILQSNSGLRTNGPLWLDDNSGTTGSGIGGTSLKYNTDLNSPLQGYWAQEDHPDDDPILARTANKLNQLTAVGSVAARTWPGYQRDLQNVARLETTVFSALNVIAGNTAALAPVTRGLDNPLAWTFGSAVLRKDWVLYSFSTLALSRSAQSILESTTSCPGLTLRWPGISCRAEGTGARYMERFWGIPSKDVISKGGFPLGGSRGGTGDLNAPESPVFRLGASSQDTTDKTYGGQSVPPAGARSLAAGRVPESLDPLTDQRAQEEQ